MLSINIKLDYIYEGALKKSKKIIRKTKKLLQLWQKLWKMLLIMRSMQQTQKQMLDKNVSSACKNKLLELLETPYKLDANIWTISSEAI